MRTGQQNRTAPNSQDAPVQPAKAIQLVEAVKPETLARWDSFGYPAQKIALMQQQIAPTATLAELVYFIERCIASRLDPFKRQIYFVKRRDSKSPTGYSCAHQVGIDGFRAIAAETGAYAGSDEPEFEGEVRLSNGKVAPALARVTVWRIVQGVRCPFVGVARWEEFYPGERQGGTWLQMPHNQLAKCAEAQAQRKGFPSELGEVELAVEDRRRDGIGQFVDSALAALPREVSESALADADAYDRAMDEGYDALSPEAIKARNANVVAAPQEVREHEQSQTQAAPVSETGAEGPSDAEQAANEWIEWSDLQEMWEARPDLDFRKPPGSKASQPMLAQWKADFLKRTSPEAAKD